MIGRFIKRAAVRAAGLAITQYAAKAALQSEAGRKLLATTASKAANLAGNIAKEQITAGFNAHIRPALPSGDAIQSSVARAQSALRSAQTSVLAAQAQLQSNLENRFSRPKNKLSKQLASTAESLEEMGETLAEHQDTAADIAVADVVEEIAAQEGQDSDALLASTKKRKTLRNVAIAGGVVAGAALGLAAYGAYSIAPRKQNDRLLLERWHEIARHRYAHRGLYNNEAGIPENSLLAFRAAVEKGFGSEVDVHLTADNKLVVVHDSALDRLCGVQKIVEESTLEELRGLRLLATDEQIPTFEEVLEVYAWSGSGELPAPLIIEAKTRNNNAEQLTEKIMQALDLRPVRACIESFDPRVLQWLRQNRPEMLRGQLSENFLVDRQTKHMNIATRAGATALFGNSVGRPDFISYKFEDRKNPFVKLACNTMGAHLITWTVRNEEDMIASELEGAPVIFEGFIPTPASLIN